jgi:hypothetical protein
MDEFLIHQSWDGQGRLVRSGLRTTLRCAHPSECFLFVVFFKRRFSWFLFREESSDHYEPGQVRDGRPGAGADLDPDHS